MGALLFTGLATFGATVAIGIVAAGTPRPTDGAPALTPARRLAIVLFALASGCGIWGVIAGVLAALNGPSADIAGAAFVPVLPIVGAVVALGLMMGSFGRLDAWVLGRSVVFILPQVALTIVAAVLLIVLGGGPAVIAHRPGPVWPDVVLGVVAAGAVIGLGIVGVDQVRSLAPLDHAAPTDPTVRAALSRALLRAIPFEAVAIGSAIIAIVLVVRGSR